MGKHVLQRLRAAPPPLLGPGVLPAARPARRGAAVPRLLLRKQFGVVFLRVVRPSGIQLASVGWEQHGRRHENDAVAVPRGPEHGWCSGTAVPNWKPAVRPKPAA